MDIISAISWIVSWGIGLIILGILLYNKTQKRKAVAIQREVLMQEASQKTLDQSEIGLFIKHS